MTFCFKAFVTAVGFVLSITFGSQLALCCERHIYNNSDQSWTFHFWNDLNWGEVSLPDCGKYVGTPCTVQPHTAVEIQYIEGMYGATQGTVAITDSHGIRKDFHFDASPATTLSDTCPYIEHDGNTGAVSVNEPARGDLSVGDNAW